MTPVQEVKIDTVAGRQFSLIIEKVSGGYFISSSVSNGARDFSVLDPTETMPLASEILVEWLKRISENLDKTGDKIQDINFPCNDEFKVVDDIKKFLEDSDSGTTLRLNGEPVT